jgi:predicted DsbA family dithiol-disulfide isomerase
MTVTPLRIDVWSDIACPWCYVGKRRLEAALAKFPHDHELTFHSFELDPNAPPVRDGDYVERLAKKYRLPVAQAQQMIERMTQTAAAEGIEMRFEQVRGGNTFDAHRLLHLAREASLQVALKERLMLAYFTEGVAIGDREALVPLAVEAGLGEREVRDVLAGDRYTRAVRDDEQLAAELGITGVPFFVFGGRIAVSGAQTPDVLLGALEKSLADAGGLAATPPQ